MDDETSEGSPVLLRPMGVADEKQCLRAHEELAQDDFEFLFDRSQGESWPVYVGRVEGLRRGVDLPEDGVPATFLLAEVDGEIVGRVSIRHELNPYLLAFGGHIGYGVRPGSRRRGYATAILRGSLPVAASIGLERVLLTCDDDNVGSATVIERCGGVLENVLPVAGSPMARRRYWVEAG